MSSANNSQDLRPTREPALGPFDPGYYKQRVREGEQAMRPQPVRRSTCRGAPLHMLEPWQRELIRQAEDLELQRAAAQENT